MNVVTHLVHLHPRRQDSSLQIITIKNKRAKSLPGGECQRWNHQMEPCHDHAAHQLLVLSLGHIPRPKAALTSNIQGRQRRVLSQCRRQCYNAFSTDATVCNKQPSRQEPEVTSFMRTNRLPLAMPCQAVHTGNQLGSMQKLSQCAGSVHTNTLAFLTVNTQRRQR